MQRHVMRIRSITYFAQIEQLAAILLDVAALALRLDKLLTARLMPMPGKIAGDAISFNFPYSADGEVMHHKAQALGDLLAGDEQFDLRPIRRYA